jgi:hypothetical protein
VLLFVYGSTALLIGLGRFFSFLILYTVGMTPWTGDQPVARPLPTHRIDAHRHPCLEWHSVRSCSAETLGKKSTWKRSGWDDNADRQHTAASGSLSAEGWSDRPCFKLLSLGLLLTGIGNIIIIIIITGSRGKLSRYSDWCRAGRPRCRSSSPGRGKIFICSSSSTKVLRPTWPPMRWIPGLFPRG